MDGSIWVYLFLTVVTVALAAAVNLERARDIGTKGSRQEHWNKVLVFCVFLLLFAVSACRIAVGNDYWVYRDGFLLIEQGRHTAYEFGFTRIVKFLQLFLSHDKYLPIFAVFSFFTVLFFVKGIYEESDWFGYSLFLFMTAGYYFSSLNSVRYYLVLSMAIFGTRYVHRREWLKFVLWICLAACFHKSVLVVIPLYFLASKRWKNWHLAVFSAFCLSLIFFQDFYRKIIFTFYPFYENSMFDTGETSVTNLVRCLAVLVLSLLYYKQIIGKNDRYVFYFNCNLGALALYAFGSFIPEISRIGYYLNVTHIFLIPGILMNIKKKKWRWFWAIAVTFAFISYFTLFLRSAYSTDIRLLPYRNWIFH